MGLTLILAMEVFRVVLLKFIPDECKVKDDIEKLLQIIILDFGKVMWSNLHIMNKTNKLKLILCIILVALNEESIAVHRRQGLMNYVSTYLLGLLPSSARRRQAWVEYRSISPANTRRQASVEYQSIVPANTTSAGATAPSQSSQAVSLPNSILEPEVVDESIVFEEYKKRFSTLLEQAEKTIREKDDLKVKYGIVVEDPRPKLSEFDKTIYKYQALATIARIKEFSDLPVTKLFRDQSSSLDRFVFKTYGPSDQLEMSIHLCSGNRKYIISNSGEPCIWAYTWDLIINPHDPRMDESLAISNLGKNGVVVDWPIEDPVDTHGSKWIALPLQFENADFFLPPNIEVLNALSIGTITENWHPEPSLPGASSSKYAQQ